MIAHSGFRFADGVLQNRALALPLLKKHCQKDAQMEAIEWLRLLP